MKENLLASCRPVRPMFATDYDLSGNEVPALTRAAFDAGCNCLSFPNIGNVGIFPKAEAKLCTASDPEALQTCDGLSGRNLPQYSETFELVGVSYHIEFQETIKRCRSELLNNEPVATKLKFEPDNGKDRNAIVFQVSKQGHWKSIGYIPGQRVCKVYSALLKDEITSTRFEYSTRKYNHAVNAFIHVPTVTVVKHGPWPMNDKDYQYNQQIDVI